MTIENQVAPTAPTQSNPVSETNISQNTAPTTPNFDFNTFFPEDIRKDADYERLSKNFPKDLSAIAKDYYHKNKHFGKARDVVEAELKAQMSQPASFKPEDYQINLPEGYSIEDNIVNTAKTKALELGIKPEVAQQFLNSIFEADRTQEIELERQAYEANKQSLENIKKEWGFDYERRADIAEKTLMNYVSPDEMENIHKLPLDQKVLLSKIMDKVASKVSEGSIGNNLKPIVAKSPEETFNDILKDKTHPYHRGDTKAVNEIFEMLKKPYL